MPIDQTTIRCPACRGLAAVPPDHAHEMIADSVRAGCPVTYIGTCEAGPAGMTVLDEDMQPVPLPAAKGWDHFA